MQKHAADVFQSLRYDACNTNYIFVSVVIGLQCPQSMSEMLPVTSELVTEVVRDSKPAMVTDRDTTLEDEGQCCYCLKLFPLCQLISHVERCCQNTSKVNKCHPVE